MWRYDTRVYRVADFYNTDHRSDMRIRLPAAKKQRRALIDVDRLKNLENRLEFELKVANRFESLEDETSNIEERWTQLREAVTQSALKVCGTRKRRKPVWLSDEVMDLAEKKTRLFVEWQATEGSDKAAKYEEYRATNRACIKATKEAKRSVWARKGSEVEQEARQNNTRAMYQKLNELRGKSGTGIDLLRDSQGNLILGSGERRKKWKDDIECGISTDEK